MASAPPQIFSPARRAAWRRRVAHAQTQPDAAHFVMDDMVEDVAERLAFLRHEPRRALVIGDYSGALARLLVAGGCHVTAANGAGTNTADAILLDEEAPLPMSGFDLVASLCSLDTVNDLPGALIHLRKAMAPGGLMLASFPGAGSLPRLRAIMLAADDDRPAGRIHPMVDVRAGAQLVQRAGFADPVADSRTLTVAWRSMERMVADLRAQGLGNALTRPAPPYGKAWLHSARAAFAEQADADGRVVETIELLTLSGRA